MSKILPNTDFQKNAHFKSFQEYEELYKYSKENFLEFWEKMARENLHFFEDFSEVLNKKNYPKVEWFVGGKVNICYQAVDFWAEKTPEKIALIFEGERGDSEKIIYKTLQEKVCQSANILTKMGVRKGDGVIFYMPQILESVYLMLACLRIGAIHSVVFGGFSAESLKDRIEDLGADYLITADGAFRKGKKYFLKNIADEALQLSKHKIKKTLIIKRNFSDITVGDDDVIYNDEVEKQEKYCDFEKLDSEDTSFVLYTSGSTGKPKGIIHSTAGYMLWAKLTTRWVFDLHENDIFFSTADIGWITGHTYTVYGPLLNGGTTVLYEGNPMYPNAGRVWEIIEKYRISQFYTAPTLLRLLKKMGENLLQEFDLSSLRVLGTVGEPIDSETWNWYYEKVGNKKASVVDTYWQTETGGHILAPLPFATPMKPMSATFPLPGIMGEVIDKNGKKIGKGESGFFTITKPWPSMMRGIWGDAEKMQKNYFGDIHRDERGLYFSGDGGFYDEDGYIFITGRVDDIVNISGHKIGIAEIEDIVNKNKNVAECGIVGIPDSITGETLFAFLVMKENENNRNKDEILDILNIQLRKDIGPIIQLKNIVIISGLPKTRSGKVVRRVLRSFACGEKLSGDFSTIENKNVLNEIEEQMKQL